MTLLQVTKNGAFCRINAGGLWYLVKKQAKKVEGPGTDEAQSARTRQPDRDYLKSLPNRVHPFVLQPQCTYVWILFLFLPIAIAFVCCVVTTHACCVF